MKPFKSMLFRYLLLILILSIATPMIAVGNEQSLEAIQKDFRNVLKEKKPEKQLKKHRDLVNKWKEKGYLEDLISLYETDAETEHANAGLHYGLGYAYATPREDRYGANGVPFLKRLHINLNKLSRLSQLCRRHISVLAQSIKSRVS